MRSNVYRNVFIPGLQVTKYAIVKGSLLFLRGALQWKAERHESCNVCVPRGRNSHQTPRVCVWKPTRLAKRIADHLGHIPDIRTELTILMSPRVPFSNGSTDVACYESDQGYFPRQGRRINYDLEIRKSNPKQREQLSSLHSLYQTW